MQRSHTSTSKHKMAAGADPAAASCVKALAAFVERGKALLERAETESREGRQHFVQHVKIDAVTCSWWAIYGHSASVDSRRPVNHWT